MTRPVSSSRVLLVEDRRGAIDAPAPVVPFKRYRLARLRFDGHPGAAEARFEYLKHAHD